MHVPRLAPRVLRTALVAALLATGLASTPAAGAEAATDPSDIVLVLDFSGSILDDAATRTNFADALDGIAGRVEETAATLVAGDATVSIIRFATRAADVSGCTGLQLRDNPDAVAAFAGCLRDVAATYRTGRTAPLTNAIGDDTNYVAAMERAAVHLPADSARPAIIFFTDGLHEADGVPVSQVVPARDRLFGDRSPFALLPVGMGLDAEDRPRLEPGLVDLRITRDLERCEGGPFEWPNVVFDTAEAAGQAVGLALQDVSCTFTVEPTPTPPPSPTPPPAAPVQAISVSPGDAEIEVGWGPPSDADANPVLDYLVRCRPAAGGDAVESTEGVSTETSATVEGLANGVAYTCEVAAVRASGPDEWTPGPLTAAPFGRPPPPTKPSIVPLDGAARLVLSMPADAPVEGFEYECSTDGGTTWAIDRQVDSGQRTVDITGLTNGTEYVCRAFATNGSGISDASPLSDAFRPCAGLADCNPLVLPIAGALGLLAAVLLAFMLFRWYAGRRVYVTAQVDNYAPVTLGRGPRVGMSFVTHGPYRRVAGVKGNERPDADVRIRYRGGRTLEVTSPGSRVKTEFGRVVLVKDQGGATHSVVLRAYDEPPQA